MFCVMIKDFKRFDYEIFCKEVQCIDKHKLKILQDKFHKVLLFLKAVFKSRHKSMKLKFYFDH
jgi:hypothetical protein